MTREIKFRAWDEEQKMMVNSDRSIATILANHICGNLDLHSAGTNKNEKPIYKLMQFTGILDCEGKEIYEGDILLASAYDESKSEIKIIEDIRDLYTGAALDNSYFNFKIIGNIYENEELLKND